jgi:CubicO group peptidase (beta-lactamase class C family)
VPVRRAVVILSTAVALCASADARQSERPPTPENPTLSLQAAEAAAERLPRLNSLLVSWQGDIVLERYYRGAGASRLANVKSVSKSVISALVGIAIARGHLKSVHQPIREFFPAIPGGPSAAAKGSITIEHLLTMRSGLESTSSRNYGAWVRSRNWVRHALERELLSEPGTTMEYSTGNTHLLSAILTKATGTSTWQFANNALAKPLGFALARWTRDPQGVYFGGNEMLLTPRQMVAFGELYLDRGTARGVQILPAAWIDASFIPRGASRWSGRQYGYGWWMRALAGWQAYYAWGFGGQFIFVVPDLQLVVATTSATTVDDERRDHRDAIYDLVERFVIEPIGTLDR